MEDEIPQPGTRIAVQLGCSCPPLVYTPRCIIHRWVCQNTSTCRHFIEGYQPTLEDMQNDTQGAYITYNHSRPHIACEHCTIPRIECAVCGLVWADWRTTAEQSRWINVQPETENLKPVWRCSTCRGGGEREHGG